MDFHNSFLNKTRRVILTIPGDKWVKKYRQLFLKINYARNLNFGYKKFTLGDKGLIFSGSGALGPSINVQKTELKYLVPKIVMN